ncbi:hypothetical protein H072_3344 [Dactylellina haptotyla CBS 200.50]|uniref:Thioesterase domain-containing protein n=1 Tax=Dactylellina haptotyla (strain CBS 200.50) TaxID=1284197 RepID=S8AI58_DACHA|nr:hypothetical protein H072_3344 [Dactylellina haptotyla CBS 200.50]
MATKTDEECLALAKESIFRSFGKLTDTDGNPRQNWGKDIYTDMEPIHATMNPNPSITFSFKVDDCYTNVAGNLHGGAASTIFDIATSMVLVLVQKDGFWERWGVSRTLNCTYLKPAPAGINITVFCEIVSLGKRLVHMRGVMKNEKGDILVTCEHGKVSVDPPKI